MLPFNNYLAIRKNFALRELKGRKISHGNASTEGIFCLIGFQDIENFDFYIEQLKLFYSAVLQLISNTNDNEFEIDSPCVSKKSKFLQTLKNLNFESRK